MRKVDLNKKAIAMRRRGLTYSAILEKIPVAKSTLALWFKEVKLSQPQTQRITAKRIAGALRGAAKKKEMRIGRTEKIISEAEQEAKELINMPLWIAGLILYWAEGSKEKSWRTGEMMHFSNMDPHMHYIFIKWATKYLCSKEDLFYEIYIHENSDVKSAKIFWSKKFNLDENILRVYFKKDNSKKFRKNTGNTYHGLLRIGVRKSVDLNRKIAGWAKGVLKYL